MEFKYAAELPPGCPPEECEPEDVTVFRFARDPLEDEWNDLPVSKQSPTRRFRPERRCSSLGLSCFRDQESATRTLSGLLGRNPALRSKIGDNIVSVQVTRDDGVLTQHDKPHTDLHEYQGISLRGRYTPVARIPPAEQRAHS